MFGNYFYNESMRRMTIGFGQIFNNIQIKRKNDAGKVIQTIRVPLAYGPKEKFLVRLDQLAHQMSLENEDGALLLENDGADSSSNYLLMETYDIQSQSPYADNNDLDQQAGFDTSSTADDILDFTERNPFGEVDF